MRNTRAMRAKCRRTEFHQNIIWVTVRGVRVRRTVYDPLEWFLDRLNYPLEPWQRKVMRAIIERESKRELLINEPWHIAVPQRPTGYDERAAMIHMFAEQRIMERSRQPVKITDISMS